MMAVDKNTPAFPPTFGVSGECGEGMSLRDWFAGQALPAIILATSEGRHNPVTSHGLSVEKSIAMDAYLMADSMMEARK